MKKIAVVSAILETPEVNQQAFNDIVSQYKHMVRGRMGLPFQNEQNDIAVIAITVIGSMDEINSFTGRLGQISDITVKVAVSKTEWDS